MPYLIRVADSTQLCLSFSRRHMRLCTQYGYEAEGVTTLEQLCNGLKDKQALSDQAQEYRVDLHDDIVNKDNDLDDMVRTLFERCKQYDREQVNTKQVLAHLFPSQTFGPLIRQNRDKQLIELENVAVKLEALGETHPLFPLATELRTKMKSVSDSIQIYLEALRLEEAAKAEEEIAKEEVCAQYAVSFYDACKAIGKKRAAYLFPKRKTNKGVVKPIEE